MLEEKELILRAQKGDISAFELLIKDYQNKIYNLALYKTNDLHLAEDIAQEVILKIYKKISQFNFKGAFQNWVYRITYNTINDIVKKFKQYILLEENEQNTLLDKHTISPEYPEQDLQDKISSEKLKSLIRKLPHKFQFVLLLYEIEGKQYHEIAEILKVSEGTVKSRLYRARKKLKKLAEKEGLV